MTDLLTLLNTSPQWFIGLAVVTGLLVGSFLNVVIHRLPVMMEREWRGQCAELLQGETAGLSAKDGANSRNPAYNLVTPRSACPACGHQITALENIPVLSYLLLRGRCKACQAPISARYPSVEVLSGLVSGYCAWHFGFGLAALGAMIFAWALMALMFIDLDTQLLPDAITQPLLWAGLLINLGGVYTDLPSALLGAVAGYLVLWSVYWLFKLLTKKEGMGYGDFKLLAAIGAWLGWKVLPLVILLSAGVGAVVGIALIVLAKHGRNVPIPFGPYLAGAGLIAMVWGNGIIDVYLRGL